MIVSPATAGSTYIVQRYFWCIYAITSGLNKGTTHGVVEPFYDLYMANGDPNDLTACRSAKSKCSPVASASSSSKVADPKFNPGGGGPTGQLPVSSIAIGGVTLGIRSLSLSAIPSP